VQGTGGSGMGSVGSMMGGMMSGLSSGGGQAGGQGGGVQGTGGSGMGSVGSMMGGMMSGISSGLAGGSARRAPPIPPPAPLASSPISPHDECDCGGDPTKYSTLGSAVNCFGANDVTNLEVMFSGLAVTDETRAFYTLCSDYDNDGVFRANDLTNMKRYYAGLLPMASHVG